MAKVGGIVIEQRVGGAMNIQDLGLWMHARCPKCAKWYHSIVVNNQAENFTEDREAFCCPKCGTHVESKGNRGTHFSNTEIVEKENKVMFKHSTIGYEIKVASHPCERPEGADESEEIHCRVWEDGYFYFYGKNGLRRCSSTKPTFLVTWEQHFTGLTFKKNAIYYWSFPAKNGRVLRHKSKCYNVTYKPEKIRDHMHPWDEKDLEDVMVPVGDEYFLLGDRVRKVGTITAACNLSLAYLHANRPGTKGLVHELMHSDVAVT